jgi:hypothetical protein
MTSTDTIVKEAKGESAPHLAQSDHLGRRFYTDPASGATFPSVTTVIGCIHHRRVENWQVRKAIEWTLANGYAVDPRAPHDEAVRELAAQFYRWMPAAERGTRIHAHAESLALGATTPDIANASERNATRAAERFLAERVAEVIGTEVTVFNWTAGYAGTADLLYRAHDGATVIADYKTGRVKDTAALQLAALANSEAAVLPDGSRSGLPTFDRLEVVELVSSGRYKVHRVTNPSAAYTRFLEVLAVFPLSDGDKTGLLAEE